MVRRLSGVEILVRGPLLRAMRDAQVLTSGTQPSTLKVALRYHVDSSRLVIDAFWPWKAQSKDATASSVLPSTEDSHSTRGRSEGARHGVADDGQ